MDVLLQETGKVHCVHRPATASQAHPSFAAQRALAASSCQQSRGTAAGKAAPQLHHPAQKCGSGWERLFEPIPATLVKPVVCCVQVMQLVEFLIQHHEEFLGEEAAGLASEGNEEPPAPQMAPETAEVREVHKQRDNKSLPPQKVELPPQGQAWSSTSLQLCQSAEQG